MHQLSVKNFTLCMCHVIRTEAVHNDIRLAMRLSIWHDSCMSGQQMRKRRLKRTRILIQQWLLRLCQWAMSYCPFFKVRKDRKINIDSVRSDSPYGSSPTGPTTCSTSNHSLLTLSFVSFVPKNMESFVFNYLYPCSPSRFTCSPNIAPHGLSNILQHNCASFCNASLIAYHII